MTRMARISSGSHGIGDGTRADLRLGRDGFDLLRRKYEEAGEGKEIQRRCTLNEARHFPVLSGEQVDEIASPGSFAFFLKKPCLDAP